MHIEKYTLIACESGLIYGPYETYAMARNHAEAFATWEIITDDERLVDWSCPNPTPQPDASSKDVVESGRVSAQRELPKLATWSRRSAA